MRFTKFFNPAVVRHDLRRSWVLILVAAVFYLLLPLSLLSMRESDYQYDVEPYAVEEAAEAAESDDAAAITGSPFLDKTDNFAKETLRRVADDGVTLAYANALFALITAMLLFSHLYSSRAANALHALPVTRTQLFCGHFVSALVIQGVPLLVMLGATYPILFARNALDYALLGDISLGILFTFVWYYAFAAFCCQFTGMILAVPVFYGVVGILPFLTRTLVICLNDVYLFGASGNTQASERFFEKISPLMGAFYAYGTVNENVTVNGLGALGVYALAGLALLGVTLLVYRRRPLEDAGEIVLYPAIRLLFHVGVAFSVGFCGWLVLEGIFETESTVTLFVFLLPGVTLGWFGAQMLLSKSFKVFNRRSLCGLGGLAAACAAIAVIYATGGLGFESRIPNADAVESIGLAFDNDLYYGPVNIVYTNSDTIQVTDPAEIEAFTQWHRQYLDTYLHNREAIQEEYNSEAAIADAVYCETGESLYGIRYVNGWVDVTYHLKNGGTLCRQYQLVVTDDALKDPATLAAKLENILAAGFDLIEVLEQNAKTLEGEWSFYSAKEQEMLCTAASANTVQLLMEDLKGQNYSLSLLTDNNDEANLYISSNMNWQEGDNYYRFDVTVNEKTPHLNEERKKAMEQAEK